MNSFYQQALIRFSAALNRFTNSCYRKDNFEWLILQIEKTTCMNL